MQTNNWWIRELFRYSLASLSSLTIVIYIISFGIVSLFGNKNPKTINDIFIQNNNRITYESDTKNADNLKPITSDLWDNYYSENEYFGLKWTLLTKNTLNINKKIYTNQFLQNGKKSKWDSFDIEKIIADLNLSKEKRVAVIAKELWIDWKKEKWDYAKLAWIEWKYSWSLDQNQKIRSYLIRNAKEIYMDKHWWNERETLPLVAKKWKEDVKLNAKEITWQVTYNDVTLKVTAPVGSFPEGSILKIKTLGDDDSMTTIDITLKEVMLLTQVESLDFNAPMVSFDISFYAPNDTEFIKELQPSEWKFISVVFDYANNDGFKNPENEWFLAVYHMEEDNETSIANLVDAKKSQETKKDSTSDSIGIYANTLSVYILTVVSNLDESVSQDNKAIIFDAGTGWFIVDEENIVLSSTCETENCIYTWMILAKDNTITLPYVHTTWYNFWWWYDWDIFLWNAWAQFKLWDFNNLTSNQQNTSDIKIYACLYTWWITTNICSPNKDLDSELVVPKESLNNAAYIPSEEEIKKYGQEVFDAYNRAINNWITTIDDINKAKLNTNITRAELAKMMVVFMSWVLEKSPIITDNTDYRDVNEKKLWDLTWYIQLAYQYQIMWINADWSPMENFNPNKPVSRAEFATVLSRVLFGNTYNQNWAKYYENHITALNNANILNDTNPNLTEWRWWIMTMLYRSQL